jgi:DNA-binding MarR family transcriptional regulator
MNQVDKESRVEDLLPANWNQSVLLALAVTGHVFRAAFEGFMGMPISRLRLLMNMYARGELSQADLQRFLEVDGATITRQVKQMEAEGLLQRRADPKDNRFTLVALTTAGGATVEALIKRGREFEQVAVAGIDRKQLRDAAEVLAQMRCNLQPLAGGNHCRSPQQGNIKE